MIKKTIAVLLIVLLVSSLSGCHEDVFYTENIAFYEENGINEWDIFPDIIPNNADVIKFSYYDYYGEDCDVYLELRFETLSDMESYIDEFKATLLKKYPTYNALYNKDCLFMIESLYDESYEEMLYLGDGAYRKSDNTYSFGYTIENSTAVFYLDILSYSKDDLCVIHSSTSGTFNNANDYTPMYLQRFGGTLDKDVDRMYIFTEKDSELFLNNEN